MSANGDVPPAAFCGGCGDAGIRAACAGSLARLGSLKVHWECWSECNLACQFCYRTRGVPLGTPDADRLLAAVATAGAETVVFAGGDPSLRKDLGHLLERAMALGLQTDVQTNAQFAPEPFLRALSRAGSAGLSLDGSTAEVHDRFRSKPGNFERVFRLLGFLDRVGVPVIVRTVVARPNFRQVADLGKLLLPYRNVTFWHLLEFSAVGAGYRNRGVYELERARFDEVVAEVRDRYSGELKVHARGSEDKSAAYVMITPDGDAYGTSDPMVEGAYPRVGSVLQKHLSELAAKIEFNRSLHEPRYRTLDAAVRQKRSELAPRRPDDSG